MSYQRFRKPKTDFGPATLATTATEWAETRESVADVAGVAAPSPETSAESVAVVASVAAALRDVAPILRSPSRLPASGPGIRILRPAIEVSAAEYDAHLDALIAGQPDGSAERSRLAFAKRKGWCVERGGERIFTRGRF